MTKDILEKSFSTKNGHNWAPSSLTIDIDGHVLHRRARAPTRAVEGLHSEANTHARHQALHAGTVLIPSHLRHWICSSIHKYPVLHDESVFFGGSLPGDHHCALLQFRAQDHWRARHCQGDAKYALFMSKGADTLAAIAVSITSLVIL